MKKYVFFALLFCSFLFAAFSQESLPKNQNLLILPEDLRIETVEGGCNLFIKKKAGIESVMLTETTKDPLGKEPNYSYRAKEYNPVNGDEIRILDGEILDAKRRALYFLIDSTPQPDKEFGQAFLIFIPEEIIFGYEEGRHGTVQIGKGTFVNIRAFEKKHCDYTGAFFDNPYMYDFERRKIPAPEKIVLTDDYNPVAADKFKEISDMMVYSKGPDTLLDDISDVFRAIDPKNIVDVVFAIDATGSMQDDIELLREKLIPRLSQELLSFGDVRIGLLLYRDYGDNFNTRDLPVKFFAFTSDLNLFLKNLNSFKIRGNEGGDIPEAVYEALYASMEFYKWREAAVKKVILIGDAEPHPTPRRSKKYTKELIETLSKERGISISAIITPDDKARRGR